MERKKKIVEILQKKSENLKPLRIFFLIQERYFEGTPNGVEIEKEEVDNHDNKISITIVEPTDKQTEI